MFTARMELMPGSHDLDDLRPGRLLKVTRVYAQSDATPAFGGQGGTHQVLVRGPGDIALAMTLLTSKAERKGLQLACAIDPNAPDELMGDSLRLWQVLNNLLAKAVCSTSPRSSECRVR
jgi:hypothetical protein